MLAIRPVHMTARPVVMVVVVVVMVTALAVVVVRAVFVVNVLFGCGIHHDAFHATADTADHLQRTGSKHLRHSRRKGTS